MAAFFPFLVIHKIMACLNYEHLRFDEIEKVKKLYVKKERIKLGRRMGSIAVGTERIALERGCPGKTSLIK